MRKIPMDVDLQVSLATASTRKLQLERNGSVFSTDDFTRCFITMGAHASFPYRYVDIDSKTHGDFSFIGRDFTRTDIARRCRIRVTVPRGKFLLFELLDLVLPCPSGALRIFNSSGAVSSDLAAEFCEKSDGVEHDSRLILPFHVGVLTFSMLRFSPDYAIHLRFSAIAQSEGHQLQHIVVSKFKGFQLFLCYSINL